MHKNQPERGMSSEEEAPENSPFTYPVCNTEFSNLEVDLAWTTGNGSQKAKQQLEIFAVEITFLEKKRQVPPKRTTKKSLIKMKATVFFSYNSENIFVNKLMIVSKRRSFSCRNYWEFPLNCVCKKFSLVDWTEFPMSPNRCRHRSKVIPR